MLVEGLENFGQVTYLGTMPIAGKEGLCDVLEASYDDVECRFYCDPVDGNLIAMDMTPELDVDPCELYFDHFQEFSGRWLPSRIEVRHGDGYGYLFLVKHYGFNVEGPQDGE